jgi:hypothetical protein
MNRRFERRTVRDKIDAPRIDANFAELEKSLPGILIHDWGTITADTTLPIAENDVNVVTLGANITNLTLAVPTTVPDRTVVRIEVKQDTTGNRLVTNWVNGAWLSASAITLSATASATDVIEATYLAAATGVSPTWRLRPLGANATFPLVATNGVAFPATQVPSTNANTLDDYEEGTWTPTDASGAALSLTINNAFYTKIGRFVNLSADITYPATADGSPTAIGGNPFTIAGGNAPGMVGFCSSVVADVKAYADATAIYLNATAGAVVTNANMSGKRIVLGVTYRV